MLRGVRALWHRLPLRVRDWLINGLLVVLMVVAMLAPSAVVWFDK